MYYSYVMGIDESIYTLTQLGFVIERDEENNYMVSFHKEQVGIWEDFICKHLEVDYWNEYLTECGVVFLFHLKEGVKRYIVENYENNEVLELCEKLCECKIESIKAMLSENHFYRDKMNMD